MFQFAWRMAAGLPTCNSLMSSSLAILWTCARLSMHGALPFHLYSSWHLWIIGSLTYGIQLPLCCQGNMTFPTLTGTIICCGSLMASPLSTLCLPSSSTMTNSTGPFRIRYMLPYILMTILTPPLSLPPNLWPIGLMVAHSSRVGMVPNQNFCCKLQWFVGNVHGMDQYLLATAMGQLQHNHPFPLLHP